MPGQILVTSAMGFKGSKILTFLESRGHSVVGVDKYIVPDKNKGTRFFKLDLKHYDSVRLLTEVSKPETLVYCLDESGRNNEELFVDYNSIIYTNLLLSLVSHNLKNLILCLNNSPVAIHNLENLVQFDLETITKLFAEKYKLNYLVINNNDNLLKAIKKFLSSEIGEERGE